MFEQVALFERGVGEVTDIIEKELFRIVPRSEEAEAWALRPEPTAGIVRAIVVEWADTWRRAWTEWVRGSAAERAGGGGE